MVMCGFVSGTFGGLASTYVVLKGFVFGVRKGKSGEDELSVVGKGFTVGMG